MLTIEERGFGEPASPHFTQAVGDLLEPVREYVFDSFQKHRLDAA